VFAEACRETGALGQGAGGQYPHVPQGLFGWTRTVQVAAAAPRLLPVRGAPSFARELERGVDAAPLLALPGACQIVPLPTPLYRFKFQSNLIWDSIKPISNFCFRF
jgi:hypothetical protein